MTAPPKDLIVLNDQQRAGLRLTVLAGLAVIAVAAWLITGSDSDEADTVAPSAESIQIVSEEDLADLAAQAKGPVYWAGEIPKKELGLTEPPEGGTRILYLPEGDDDDEVSTEVLTITTYRLPDPKAALEKFAGRKSSITRRAGDGRVVVTSKAQPTSVYFVSPGNAAQIEIYDPSPARAMRLALSDTVKPVE